MGKRTEEAIDKIVEIVCKILAWSGFIVAGVDYRTGDKVSALYFIGLAIWWYIVGERHRKQLEPTN